MNLNQLRTLIHVGELGSLSKASERLYLAQPALSRQIRALEEELGRKLFTRHGRGMVLTETGEMLRDRAMNILNQVEAARADAIASTGWVRGNVTIGLPPTVAHILAGRLAKQFSQQYPDVRLHFTSAFTSTLIEWLKNGSIDLAILYDPKTPSDLRLQPLFIEELFLVSQADAKLSTKRPVPFKRLAKETLMLPGRQHSLRQLVERQAENAGCQLNVSIEADALIILKDFVSLGLGSAILPLPSVHKEVMEGSMSAAPLKDPQLTRRLVLATPIDRALSNAVHRATELIEAEVFEMVATEIWMGEPL